STQRRRFGERPGGTQSSERALTSRAHGKGTTSCKWDSVRAAQSVGRSLTSAPTPSFGRGTFSSSTARPGAWKSRSAPAERVTKLGVNQGLANRVENQAF